MKPAFDSARRARPLLGTFVEISAGGAPRVALDAAIGRAFEAVAEVHRLMSPHDPHGDVARLNTEAARQAVRVHPSTHEVLRTACELHDITDGVFDVTLGSRSSPSAPRPRSAIGLLPGYRIRFHSAVRVDLGGIAKGFAVDRAIACLRASGIPRGVVNAGGDLAVFGEDAAVVAIRDPRHPERELCRIKVRNAALASSGGRFDPFVSPEPTDTEIVDPETGAPIREILGATVRATSCMIADALTKVVMLTGESAAPLLARYEASALFVSADGDVSATREWSDGVHEGLARAFQGR
jgi:thiamine biosynthesis lipoprotein